MSQLSIEASLSSIAASLALIAQHLSTASPAAAAAAEPTPKASTASTTRAAKAADKAPVEQPEEPAGDTFDVKALQAKCMSLSAKLGAQALLEQFQKVDAGKWSEVKAENYPTLEQNIDDALAAADAMG